MVSPLVSKTYKNYCTYIRAYLDYLTNVLHKSPEEVSWEELRDYIRWLQKTRRLSDRTVNCAVLQLRFFTIYVLHRPWDDTQLPMRRFDKYLPYVPSKQDAWAFLSTIPDLKRKTMATLMYSSGLHITHGKNRHDRYAILSKTAHAILNCKSGKLGCNVSRCSDCGHIEFHNNSCRNRSRPNCQAVLKEI